MDGQTSYSLTSEKAQRSQPEPGEPGCCTKVKPATASPAI